MLKKSLVLFGMVAAFVGNAGAAAVTPSQESSGDRCYLIGTADELEGFAKNVAASGFSGCAKLTADIRYIGNAKLLNDAGDGINSAISEGDVKRWIPLQNFTGKFDGQNHTIYGLYTSANDGGNGAAFIRNVSGSAEIKNLHIADSYFYVNKNTTCNRNNTTCYGSAGFISVAAGTPTIDKCSFSGFVGGSSTNFVDNAGLIGYAADNSAMNLTNSYNEGKIVNGAGLVGNVGKNSAASVTNCYNIGDADNGPILGERGRQGNIKVTGTNLGCYEPNENESICNKNFGSKNQNFAAGTFVSKDRAAVVANYWANIYGGEEKLQEKVNEIKQMIEDCKDPANECKVSGFELETEMETITYLDSDNNNQEMEIVVPVGVIHILSETDATLKIPEDIDVYKVRYDRVFSDLAEGAESPCGGNYNLSTTVLPFNISMTNVTGAVFYDVRDLHRNSENEWVVGLDEVVVRGVEAHKPYVVCPTSQTMTFGNGITIMKADGIAGSYEFDRNPIDLAGKWQFKGLYTGKKFYRPGSELENDESGRAYVFMGGKFTRAGNVSSSILRAYLLAPVGSNPNDENVTGNALAKAMARAPAADGAVVASLPTSLPLEVVGTDEGDYAKADPADLIEESTEVEQEEETLSIQKVLFNKVRSEKWRDVKGRNLGKKPSSKGAYLNNNIPVIVK